MSCHTLARSLRLSQAAYQETASLWSSDRRDNGSNPGAQVTFRVN